MCDVPSISIDDTSGDIVTLVRFFVSVSVGLIGVSTKIGLSVAIVHNNCSYAVSLMQVIVIVLLSALIVLLKYT